MKDPTAWMDDLNVYLDDESVSSMAKQQEPTATFAGSKIGVGLWTGIVGTLGGALGAVTISPDIRGSVLAFAAYLAAAVVLLRGVRPVTDRLFGPGMAWLTLTALFWGFFCGLTAAIGGRVGSAALGYGISGAGGFFIGMMVGSFHPPFVKSEESWMLCSLILGPAALSLGTALLRAVYDRSGEAEAVLAAGALAAGAFTLPLSAFMVAFWDETQVLYRTALLLLHNDNFAQRAVAYLDRAISLTPGDARLYNLRGIAWSKLGRSDAARADWGRAADLGPEDPEPFLNEGTDHLRHDRVEPAIEAFERALRLDEKNARVHSNLGTALERRGDLDGAIRRYDRAIELQSDYAAAYSNRAYAYHRKGEHERAVADCDAAIRSDDRFPMAWVNRGHAQAALGRNAEAVGSYQAALLLDPEPRIREEAMQGLERLGARPDDPYDAEEPE